jgi:hypothetical protein
LALPETAFQPLLQFAKIRDNLDRHIGDQCTVFPQQGQRGCTARFTENVDRPVRKRRHVRNSRTCNRNFNEWLGALDDNSAADQHRDIVRGQTPCQSQDRVAIRLSLAPSQWQPTDQAGHQRHG